MKKQKIALYYLEPVDFAGHGIGIQSVGVSSRAILALEGITKK